MPPRVSKHRARIELRVLRTVASGSDAWLSVGSEGIAMNYPVRTELGAPLFVVDGTRRVPLRQGRLFVYSARGAEAPRTRKKSSAYGLVTCLRESQVDQEAQESFHVKLYVPDAEYERLWDLAARSLLPKTVGLEVKGLQEDHTWDLAETGRLLLVEGFDFSYLVGGGTEGAH